MHCGPKRSYSKKKKDSSAKKCTAEVHTLSAVQAYLLMTGKKVDDAPLPSCNPLPFQSDCVFAVTARGPTLVLIVIRQPALLHSGSTAKTILMIAGPCGT
jgi:hypothetical protein